MPTNGRDTKSTPWVIIALVVLSVIGSGAAVAILAVGGENTTENVQLIFTFLSPIIVGLLVALQGQKTHNLVNSTASENRRLVQELAYAQGKEKGTEIEEAKPARTLPPIISQRKGVNEVRDADIPNT